MGPIALHLLALLLWLNFDPSESRPVHKTLGPIARVSQSAHHPLVGPTVCASAHSWPPGGHQPAHVVGAVMGLGSKRGEGGWHRHTGAPNALWAPPTGSNILCVVCKEGVSKAHELGARLL